MAPDKVHPGAGKDAPLGGRIFGGRYRTVESIAEGAFSHVYLGRDLVTDQAVALKVMKPEGVDLLRARAGGGTSAIDAVLSEAVTASRLGSSHVIDVLMAGSEPDGVVYLAMEYLHGADLHRTLMSEVTLPWKRCLNIVIQAADALHTVHQAGIVHGDVKPANLFLTRDEEQRDFIKILDFGLARLTRSERNLPWGDARMVSGTPEYMAPEQVLGLPITPATDVYALGCVLYQMVTGETPFTAATQSELMAKHVHEAPVPPQERRPDLRITVRLQEAILRAIEKNPRQRWPSMKAFAEALSQCRFGIDPSETPGAEMFRAPVEPPRTGGMSRWWITVAIAIAAGALTLLIDRVVAREPPAGIARCCD